MQVSVESVGNLERLASLVEQLDAGQQHDHTLVHLQHAAAHTLVPLVEAAAGRGDAAGKVLADTRGNRVLVLGPPRVRARLERLVRAFDTPMPPAAHNWRVLRLHHADAAQLAQVQGDVLTLDVNAAGQGWFIDATPADVEAVAFATTMTMAMGDDDDDDGDGATGNEVDNDGDGATGDGRRVTTTTMTMARRRR